MASAIGSLVGEGRFCFLGGTRSLAAHLAPRGIAVNTVDPGATDPGYADDAAGSDRIRTAMRLLRRPDAGRTVRP
jgi:NAD(P)-dependent dehydrogenase (short-subunit alcohol dehydrogenase family)